MCNGFSDCKTPLSNNYFANLSKTNIKLQQILLYFAVFVLLLMFPSSAKIAFAEGSSESVMDGKIEEELGGATKDILDGINFSEVDNIFADFNISLEGYDGDFSSYVSKLIAGDVEFSFDDVLGIISSEFVTVIKGVISPLLMILAIILLCNLMNTLKSRSLSNSVSEVISFICLSVVIIIVSVLVKDVIDVCKNSVEAMVSQFNVVSPIIVTLLTTIGASASVSSIGTGLVFFSGTMMNIFREILFPIFTFVVLINIISKVTKNNRLDKMSSFFHSGFKWILSTTCTIFMALLSFHGLTAGAKDGLSVKAAKFAIKNYVPLLGGYISDGFEVVKAGSILVKNAIGFASVILLFFTIIKPIVYIAILSLGLRLVSATTDIVDDMKINSILSNIADAMKLLTAILIGVACMYFFLMMTLISTGNVIG